MSHILPLLKEMRGRLGMFIGTPSLSRLAAFLRGYDLAMQKSGSGTDPFLANFRDWVHNHLQTTSLSWEDAILEESSGEADAVKQFWKLLDKFLRETEKEQDLEAKRNGGAVSKIRTTTPSK